MFAKHKRVWLVALMVAFSMFGTGSAIQAQEPRPNLSGFGLIGSVPGAPICTPLIMNWDNLREPDRNGPPAGTHQWFLQATGNKVNITLSVVNHGTQSVNVVPLAGGPSPVGFPLRVDATGLCQPGSTGGFLYKEMSQAFDATPGAIYRILVTLDGLQVPAGCTGGPEDSGRHYRLRALGAKALATNAGPSTFSALEDGTGWLINHDTDRSFEIGFSHFPMSSPGPTAANVRLQGPMMPPSAPFSVSIPSFPGVGSTSVSGPNGIWRMNYDLVRALTDDHHHRMHLSKLGMPRSDQRTTDSHLYLDWNSCFQQEQQGGKVTGGGNKGRSDQNFGFNIQQDPGSRPRGQLEYQDRVRGINFHSDEYHALVIFRNPAPMRAIFTGEGTINGQAQRRPFVVVVTDKDEPGAGTDTFQITIFGSMPGQTVTGPEISGGNIQIHK